MKFKSEIIITLIIAILVLFLKLINVLQIENALTSHQFYTSIKNVRKNRLII